MDSVHFLLFFLDEAIGVLCSDFEMVTNWIVLYAEETDRYPNFVCYYFPGRKGE